jgi:hypothetical protein
VGRHSLSDMSEDIYNSYWPLSEATFTEMVAAVVAAMCILRMLRVTPKWTLFTTAVGVVTTELMVEDIRNIHTTRCASAFQQPYLPTRDVQTRQTWRGGRGNPHLLLATETDTTNDKVIYGYVSLLNDVMHIRPLIDPAAMSDNYVDTKIATELVRRGLASGEEKALQVSMDTAKRL